MGILTLQKLLDEINNILEIIKYKPCIESIAKFIITKLLLDRDTKANWLIAKDKDVNQMENTKVTKSNNKKGIKTMKYSLNNKKNFSKPIIEF